MPQQRVEKSKGAPAPEPCEGCGKEIIGDAWEIAHYNWKGRMIEIIRHAFSPSCDKAIRKRRDAALAAEESVV